MDTVTWYWQQFCDYVTIEKEIQLIAEVTIEQVADLYKTWDDRRQGIVAMWGNVSEGQEGLVGLL